MREQDATELKFNEMVKLIRSLDGDKGLQVLPLKIAFLRNITVDLIVPYLKFFCYKENIRADIHMGTYDMVLQDVTDAKSPLYTYAPDIIVICLKSEILAPKLCADFTGADRNDADAERSRAIGFVDTILKEMRKRTKAAILIHNFEMPIYPNLGISDYQDPQKQINTFRKMNVDLAQIAAAYSSTYIVDVDMLQSLIGYRHFIDKRYWHVARSPYTAEACRSIAAEYMKFIRALKGKSKKCLVLDCDGTLWGGIVGEDGPEGIQIGQAYPGSSYLEFQRTILAMYQRGVLLALCSRNNERDVMEVFEKHPDMILKKDHFASIRINWNDKATNLKEISDELNIGPDSMVFVDNDEFEIGLIKKMSPETITIRLPKDPSLYSDTLRSCGVFDTVSVSEEDRSRTAMYKAESKRREAKTGFKAADLEEYYRFLKMELFIRKVDRFSLPRIVQLTQKTNQFNLTTKRYTESELERLSGSVEADVYCARLEDRFGDSGIIGAVIMRYDDKDAIIDTFLVSCRVIGRRIDEALLALCIGRAVERNCDCLVGLYVATERNGQVRDFYERHAFTCLEKAAGSARYALPLKGAAAQFPGCFKSIDTDNRKIRT